METTTNGKTKAEGRGIGQLVRLINERAAATGCDARAEVVTIDRTWGDLVGIAILGKDQDRAAKFAEAYYRKHLQARRGYDSQYSWGDRGVQVMARFSAFIDGRWVEGAGQLVPGYKHPDWDARKAPPSVEGRLISLVYYPGAD